MKQINKIVFIAKTNLNNDGRILNELKILRNKFKSTVIVDFILMPDKPLTIDVKEVDHFHIINTTIRNNKVLRFLTVFEFTIMALLKFTKLKPDIIHAEDTAIALPVYLYKLIKPSVKIIYDDHEVPNANEPIQIKLFQYFENLLMIKADFIIAANQERITYLNKNLNKSTYLLNLPYFESFDASINSENVIKILSEKEKNNWSFIMHQGIIEDERGRTKLAEFSKRIPFNYKILIVGVSKDYFDDFIKQYNLDISNFYFIGSVPYQTLGEYWKLADLSLVMYLPTYVNNRLCAPNRLYISYFNQLPIIVNKDNPVLSNFIRKNNCGVYIEDITKENFNTVLNMSYSSDQINHLINKEINKFEDIYTKLLN